jgi:hypothetical protein
MNSGGSGRIGASEDILVPVEVPLLGDERRKNWAKIVHNVDEQKSSGWAFEGDFIAVGGIQDVPVGAVVLVYGERGSRANPHPMAAVYQTNGDATLTKHDEATGRAWARTLRDGVQELLSGEKPKVGQMEWQPQLMLYRDDAVIHEAKRRGLWPGGDAE